MIEKKRLILPCCWLAFVTAMAAYTFIADFSAGMKISAVLLVISAVCILLGKIDRLRKQ